VKHIKGVWQAQAEYLEQIELELVATVGQGEWLAEARMDDGHVRLCAKHSAELIMSAPLPSCS